MLYGLMAELSGAGRRRRGRSPREAGKIKQSCPILPGDN